LTTANHNVSFNARGVQRQARSSTTFTSRAAAVPFSAEDPNSGAPANPPDRICLLAAATTSSGIRTRANREFFWELPGSLEPEVQMARTNGLTQLTAEFIESVRYEDLPEEANRVGRRCILDTLGLYSAGTTAPSVEILVAEARATGGTSEALLIGAPGASTRFARGWS
jgi:hypothetical protein